MKKRNMITRILLFFLLIPVLCFATSLNVSWPPNPEPDIAGYKVSFGTTTNNYTTTVNAGNSLNYTIPNILNGSNYYVAVKAYDYTGNESLFSDEAFILVPPNYITLLTPLYGQIVSTPPTFTWSGDGYKSFILYLSMNTGSYQKIYSGTSKSYKMSIALWYWFIAPKTNLKWYVTGVFPDGRTSNSPTFSFTKK